MTTKDETYSFRYSWADAPAGVTLAEFNRTVRPKRTRREKLRALWRAITGLDGLG